jgi:hypothetical protein
MAYFASGLRQAPSTILGWSASVPSTLLGTSLAIDKNAHSRCDDHFVRDSKKLVQRSLRGSDVENQPSAKPLSKTGDHLLEHKSVAEDSRR